MFDRYGEAQDGVWYSAYVKTVINFQDL